MAVGTGTLYPTTFDDFPIMLASNYVTKAETNKQSAAIAALQRKVGVTGSASGTSIDYKLSTITGTAKVLTEAGTTILTENTFNATTNIVNLDATTIDSVSYTINGTTGVTASHPMSSGSTLIIVDGLIVNVI